MNSIMKSFFFLFSFIGVQFLCTAQNQEMINKENSLFATPEEAANKAKNDLIQILETHKDINLGIDAGKLRESQPARLVKYVMVDFNKLLTTESVRSLSDIVASEKSMISPFVLRNEIVGVVEVGRVQRGWRVAGLGNKAIRNDLTESGIMRQTFGEITLYEIPNLHIFIYEVAERDTRRYYLNLDKFSIREGVSISDFYPLIRDKARRFEEEFGDQLRRDMLLK